MTSPGPIDHSSGSRLRRSEKTRTAILRAARERFAADGYERATIRAIAADAGIDPAMVMRYYGSKERLFGVAAQFDLRLPDLSAVRRTALGETLVLTFLDRWGESDALPMMLRAAMTNVPAAAQLQVIYRDQLATAVAAVTPREEALERAGLIASQVLGLAICRYVLKFPPLDGMDTPTLVARFGPTLQRYLTGRLGTEARQADRRHPRGGAGR